MSRKFSCLLFMHIFLSFPFFPFEMTGFASFAVTIHHKNYIPILSFMMLFPFICIAFIGNAKSFLPVNSHLSSLPKPLYAEEKRPLTYGEESRKFRRTYYFQEDWVRINLVVVSFPTVCMFLIHLVYIPGETSRSSAICEDSRNLF